MVVIYYIKSTRYNEPNIQSWAGLLIWYYMALISLRMRY